MGGAFAAGLARARWYGDTLGAMHSAVGWHGMGIPDLAMDEPFDLIFYMNLMF